LRVVKLPLFVLFCAVLCKKYFYRVKITNKLNGRRVDTDRAQSTKNYDDSQRQKFITFFSITIIHLISL
jgi:hypothetical protein